MAPARRTRSKLTSSRQNTVYFGPHESTKRLTTGTSRSKEEGSTMMRLKREPRAGRTRGRVCVPRAKAPAPYTRRTSPSRVSSTSSSRISRTRIPRLEKSWRPPMWISPSPRLPRLRSTVVSRPFRVPRSLTRESFMGVRFMASLPAGRRRLPARRRGRAADRAVPGSPEGTAGRPPEECRRARSTTPRSGARRGAGDCVSGIRGPRPAPAGRRARGG